MLRMMCTKCVREVSADKLWGRNPRNPRDPDQAHRWWNVCSVCKTAYPALSPRRCPAVRRGAVDPQMALDGVR